MRVRVQADAVLALRRLGRGLAALALLAVMAVLPVAADKILAGFWTGIPESPAGFEKIRPDFYPARNPWSADIIRTSVRALTPAAPPPPVEPAVHTEQILPLALVTMEIHRIVIDPGHGGYDYGATGPDGVLEKDVVLDVALRLSGMIQRSARAEVALTRFDDSFVSLQERVAFATERHADLFLSIHANSSPLPEVTGTETYVRSAESESREKSMIDASGMLAQAIQTSLAALTPAGAGVRRSRGVKQASFQVLAGAAMPSILAEIGFLSNAREESKLNRGEYRQNVARAIFAGLWPDLPASARMAPSRARRRSRTRAR